MNFGNYLEILEKYEKYFFFASGYSASASHRSSLLKYFFLKSEHTQRGLIKGVFSSDPGVPGVRSMGPVVSHSLTWRLNLCDFSDENTN